MSMIIIKNLALSFDTFLLIPLFSVLFRFNILAHRNDFEIFLNQYWCFIFVTIILRFHKRIGCKDKNSNIWLTLSSEVWVIDLCVCTYPRILFVAFESFLLFPASLEPCRYARVIPETEPLGYWFRPPTVNIKIITFYSDKHFDINRKIY